VFDRSLPKPGIRIAANKPIDLFGWLLSGSDETAGGYGKWARHNALTSMAIIDSLKKVEILMKDFRSMLYAIDLQIVGHKHRGKLSSSLF